MARFALSQTLASTMRQEMLLLPRMLQSIEVLQLPVAELDGFLQQAVQENEALRLEPRTGDAADAPPFLGGGRASGDAERTDGWLENHPDADKGLVEVVEEQLGMLDLDEVVLEWVRFLISCLDDHGYLSTPDERLLELAAERRLAGGETELGRAIGVLQTLEPRGIGGRDAVEALLLQLEPHDPDYGALCRLLEEFLDDVLRNKLPAVARAMGVELERLGELLQRFKDLDPAPAAGLVGGPPPPIRAEVLVARGERGYEITLDQSGLPTVEIDPEIARLARDRGQAPDVRRYLRGKLDRARWLIEALDQRRHTLMRIATAVFDRQRAFLEHGPGHLAPLRMSEVAELLGIHLSTVSRGVAGKYAETPWGVFPLRHFFQGAAGGDGGTARGDLRDVVREVIEAEDPARPLSDDEVAARLAERGLDVARRTVAKYRNELGIPSSYRRRRYT